MWLISIQLGAQTITNYTTTDGLLDNFVECVDVGQDDNVWFGTSVGVQMYDDGDWYAWNQANFPDILSDNIKSIKVISSGEVWIGTDYGTNQLLYGIPGTFWVPYTTANGLINNQVKGINEDPNGDVWVGTSQGVSYFDGNSWISYSSPDLHWSGVNTTAFDSNGDAWFASPLGGITHFDGVTFTNYDTSNGLLSQNVTTLLIDNQDNKWIGTDLGMSVLNASNTSFIDHIEMYSLPPPHDSINPVVDIEMDSYGRIWTAIYVGYLGEGGVAYWNGNQWQDFHVSDGLAGPNVRDIAIDSEDNVWVATSNGVSKISSIPSIIKDLRSARVNLFPNPSNDFVYLSVDKELIQQIDIYNSSGNLVYTNRDPKEIYRLNMSSFSEGLYQITIKLNDVILNKKLIIN